MSDKEVESMPRPYLSVVIPAYNEEQRIGNTLATIYAYLAQQSYTWEIVVVLDGATDDTLGVVRRFAHDKQGIRWLDRSENRGKGYTVREGMLAARGEIRLFTDADNSTDISHFDQMKPLFDEGAAIVICSRDSKDAPGARQAVPQSGFKRFLGNSGNLLIQLLAVPGIWDTQCGFKAFRARPAATIFGVAHIDGFGFDIEALALARHFGYPVEIIAAYWVNQEGSHVKFVDYLWSFKEAFDVRWHLLLGTYKRAQQPKPVAGER
jgi:dolichyl-phosphate beta-glucosyltransferase